MFRFFTLTLITCLALSAAEPQKHPDLSALRKAGLKSTASSRFLSMPVGGGQLDIVTDPDSAARAMEAQVASSKANTNSAVTILSTDRVIPFASAGLDAENGVAVSAGFLFQNTSNSTVNILIEFFDEDGKRIALPTKTLDGRALLPASSLSGTFTSRQYQTILVDASRLPTVRSFWVRIRSTLSNSVEVLHETIFSSLELFKADEALPADLGFISDQADRMNSGGWLYFVPDSNRGDAMVVLTNGYPLKDVIVTLRARASNGRELCRALRVVPVSRMLVFSPRELDGCFASLEDGFVFEVYSDRPDLFTTGLFQPTGAPISNLARLQDQ